MSTPEPAISHDYVPDEDGIGPSSRILKFINSLKPGEMFFSRDCLNCGQRNTIDKCLSRLVRSGFLIRLAFGCFMQDVPGAKTPTKDEMAFGKAKAFGRRVFVHGVNALKEFVHVDAPHTANSVATDGASSSFISLHGRITSKSYAPRKLGLGDSVTGLLIRSLWHFKSPPFATRAWEIIRDVLGHTERAALRESCHIMPAWLVDIVKYGAKSDDELTKTQTALLNSMRLRIRSLGMTNVDDATLRSEDPLWSYAIDLSKYEDEYDPGLS